VNKSVVFGGDALWKMKDNSQKECDKGIIIMKKDRC